MAVAEDDGRRLRREQNIEAVVDAALDLITEGNVRPGAAAVAERAGVSVRSLFRYFDDLDALTYTAVERQMRRADHLFTALPTEGPFDERVERVVAHRLDLYDAIGPVLRAARLWAPVQPAISAGLSVRRRQLRSQLRAVFERELAARPQEVVVVLEVATGLEALEALRFDRRLSRSRAGRVLRVALVSALTPDRHVGGA